MCELLAQCQFEHPFLEISPVDSIGNIPGTALWESDPGDRIWGRVSLQTTCTKSECLVMNNIESSGWDVYCII
mgnify:CR=1 FL=1